MKKMMGGPHFRHILLFKIHDGVSNEKIDRAIRLLQDLGSGNEGILEWKIEKSLDNRKGIVIVENCLFIDESTYVSFSHSVKHKNVGEFMSTISDWLIGDYFEP